MTTETMNDTRPARRARPRPDRPATIWPGLWRVASASTGVVVEQVRVTPVDYPISTIATAGTRPRQRHRPVADGSTREFSIFVKQLRSARLWPLIACHPRGASDRTGWSRFPGGSSSTRSLTARRPDARRTSDGAPLRDRRERGRPGRDLDGGRRVDASTAVDHADFRSRRPICSASSPDDVRSRVTPAWDSSEMHRTPGLALRMYRREPDAGAAVPAILADAAVAAARTRTATSTPTCAPGSACGRRDRSAARPPRAAPSGVPPRRREPAEPPDSGRRARSIRRDRLGLQLPGGRRLRPRPASPRPHQRRRLSVHDLPALEPLVVRGLHRRACSRRVRCHRGAGPRGIRPLRAVRSMFTRWISTRDQPDEHWTPEHQENRIRDHLLDLCEVRASSCVPASLLGRRLRTSRVRIRTA